ncbi:hypothetical protein AB1E18_015821 [Capra hircus]
MGSIPDAHLLKEAEARESPSVPQAPRQTPAMEAEASPPVGSPPCCLWFQSPGVYKDEKGRIWVAVALQINPSHRARGSEAPESTHDHPTSTPDSAPTPAGPEDPGPWLCVQLSIPNGARLPLQHEVGLTVHLWQLPNQMPRSPSCPLVSGLPTKWELYPGRRYQGTDSRLWEIMDHGQVISTENLILKRLPSGSH